MNSYSAPPAPPKLDKGARGPPDPPQPFPVPFRPPASACGARFFSFFTANTSKKPPLFPCACERGWGDKKTKKCSIQLKRAVRSQPRRIRAPKLALSTDSTETPRGRPPPCISPSTTRLGRPSVGARAAAQSLEKVGLELPAKRLEGEARLQQCVVSSE